MGKRLMAAVGAAFVCFACAMTEAPPPAEVAAPTDAGTPAPVPDAGTPDAGASGTDGGGTGGGNDAGTTGGGTGGGNDAGTTGGGSDAGTTGGGTGGGSGGGGTGGGGADAGTPDAGTTASIERLTTGQTAWALALDATNVYWVNASGPGYELKTVPKSGGTVVTIASGDVPGGTTPVGSFVQGGFHWFFTGPVEIMRDSGRFAPGYGQLATTSGLIFSHFSEAGGGEIVARNFQPDYFHVYAVDQGYESGLTLDGNMLYWAASIPDGRVQIVRMDLSDCCAMTAVMRPGEERPAYMKVAGGYVFFRRTPAGDVMRVPQNGVNAAPELLWGAPNGQDLDLKNGRVYWNQSRSTQFPGCLGVANYDGTDGHCLDEGEHSYFGVRVDDTYIYFIRDLDIFRMPRQ